MFSKKILFPVLALAMIFAAISFLPSQANEGQSFVVSVDNVGRFPYSSNGVFNSPVGSSGPGPALPGGAYQFSFNAAPGENVSFATMFVQSNDWFLAPNELGIPVYKADGTPNTGDVTATIALWDAGSRG